MPSRCDACCSTSFRLLPLSQDPDTTFESFKLALSSFFLFCLVLLQCIELLECFLNMLSFYTSLCISKNHQLLSCNNEPDSPHSHQELYKHTVAPVSYLFLRPVESCRVRLVDTRWPFMSLMASHT